MEYLYGQINKWNLKNRISVKIIHGINKQKYSLHMEVILD